MRPLGQGRFQRVNKTTGWPRREATRGHTPLVQRCWLLGGLPRAGARALLLGLRRAAALEGVLVVADLVDPELALELPVVPRGPGHGRPVERLAGEQRLLVHTGLEQILLIQRRL